MYLSLLQGHGRGVVGRADRVQAGDEVAVVAEHVERALAHAGHDPHGGGHVGRVGELDADLGDRGAERAHAEGDDVHRVTAHRPAELLRQNRPHLLRVAPVVRRARVLLARRADERAVLHPRDVARVGEREVRVGSLGVAQTLEGARVDQALGDPVVLLRRSVAPVHRVRLRERRHLLHPAQQLLIGGQGGGFDRHGGAQPRRARQRDGGTLTYAATGDSGCHDSTVRLGGADGSLGTM